jgi:Bacterial extracellular solute-binding protein
MDGEPPRPQAPPRRDTVDSASRRVVAIVLAGVLVVSLVVVIGARAVLVRALCEQGPVRLHIAAALDIAPTVQRIGTYFNDLGRDVDGHCAQVEVTEDPPAVVAGSLSGKNTIAGESPVDAWVPDSSLWVDVVRSSPRGAAAAQLTGFSVGSSPLVIAAPRQVAGTLGGAVRLSSWKSLFPPSLGGPSTALGLRVQLPDPGQSATGLATLVEARRVLGDQPRSRDAFTAFVHNLEPTTSLNDPQALHYFTTLAQPPWNLRPVTIASEQAVEAYNQANARQPLAAFYPSDEYNLDYPFVLTTTSPLKTQTAAEFEQVLHSSFAAAYVREAGFRSAGGQADQAGSQYGIAGNPQPAVALAGPGEAGAALQEWNRLNLGDRSIVLVDISGAESLPLAPGAPTRLQVLSQAASLGLSLFPDTTEMGIWEYSTRMNGALPYREMVPLGPLPAQLGLLTRRQQLQQIANTVRPKAGASAAMYLSILAAYREMTALYQPGHVNALIVLGSGTETDRHDISLGELLTGLRKQYNPQRPVEIIAVTAGTDGELAALQQVTAITHGASYTVAQPSDIASVFFDAIARRICVPNCLGG